MIDRNKRGRRVGMKGSLAIAAAVLVGGSAAGVVALEAGHSNATTVQSASYTMSSGHTMSEPAALTMAFGDWAKSPTNSLAALARMAPTGAFREQREHGIMFAAQRGVVVSITSRFLVVKSANGALHRWRLSGATRFRDVAGTANGMTTLTGSKARAQAAQAAKDLMRGDRIFIAGTLVHGSLMAKLVLFAAPLASRPAPRPALSASPTAPPTVMVTPSPNTTINGQPVVIGSHS
jgi:hypothetical protein